MGCKCSKPAADYVIHVWTGDRRNAGTDANVYVILHEDQGYFSKAIVLDNYAKNDLERGDIDSFHVAHDKMGHLQRMGKIARIELWKDKAWPGSDWFVDKIMVENRVTGDSFMFPIFRWIKSDYHFQVQCMDTTLPQAEEFPEQRTTELEQKRATYQFEQKVPGGPAQIKTVPEDEHFSFECQWDLEAHRKKLMVTLEYNKVAFRKVGEFQSICNIRTLYGTASFPKPKGAERWRNDIYFGIQRVAGLNHSLIRLCTVIPEKFPVTEELLKPVLEGKTIAEAIKEKRLFICDLNMLDGVPVRDGFVLCAPIGLFYLDMSGNLRPVAIQLFQQPGEENPIFTPSCHETTWNLVKMWYNNADAAYHQAVAHLGLTHFLMEGVSIATHRNLSQSHPIFKLLAPHFLYLIGINNNSLNVLTAEGGWLDTTTNYGSKGVFALIEKGLSTWRMDQEGSLLKDLAKRGLSDTNVLPCYFYREDAVLLHAAINKWVASYVEIYYPTDDLLQGDSEIQGLAAELVKKRNGSEGGVGILGVPGNGKIETRQQLEQILTCIVFTCSVSHASANFPQYEEYAFPPNYPALMRGKPPVNPNIATTEKEVLSSLPDRHTTLEIMVVAKLLGEREANPLGNFEVEYVFDPRALAALNEFRSDIQFAKEKIKERNMARNPPYPYLDPEVVPNCINI